MDNIGNYTSIAELLTELGNAGEATKEKILLSNKALVSGTKFSFDYTGVAPQIGDFLVQGTFHATITAATASTLEADDASNIQNGGARWIRTDFLEIELNKFILDAMDFMDRHTRQWFNARTFDNNNPVKMEGNNSTVLFFPVPIISIDTIQKAAESEVLPADSFTIFNSRELPDDRRNPMIKLMKDSDDFLFISFGKWMRGQITIITGTFGFLEPDGSTPSLVQKATLKLALRSSIETLGEAATTSISTGNVGPIKREKTDFHEIEYYDASSGSGQNDGTGLSGDDFVDDVIAAYKGPIIVSGTFPDIGREAPLITSINV